MLCIQRLALALSLLALLLHNSMTVAAETAPSPINITIPAQPLEEALNAWASQTGYRILWSDEKGIAALMAPKVDGSLTPEAALQQLLARTGLTYQFVDAKSVAIHAIAADQAALKSTTEASGGGMRLAQSDDGSRPDAVQVGTSRKEGETNARETLEEVNVGVPEILIKGSRALNMDIKRSRDSIQPYTIFDREVIERSGSRNVEDFLRYRLTSASSPATSAQSEGGSNASHIDLRGLGDDETLVLIDGHRIASRNSGGTGSQPDLNGIPLTAIERIEVLPSTASGIYGGAATGGVVNVVLRRDYSGVDVKLGYDNSLDGGAAGRRVDMSAGINLEGGRTNVLLAGGYSDANRLLVSDRDFLKRGRALILENNPSIFFDPSAIPPLGFTTNIRSNEPLVDGVLPPLTLKAGFGGASLDSPFTSIPVGYSGPASDNGAGLVANAGQYNLDPANTIQNGAGGRQALLNTPTMSSLGLTVRREFTPWMQAFLDLSGAKNSGIFASNRVSSSFTVLATSPSNPFNEAIRVTTPAFGTDQLNTEGYSDRRAVGGVIFRLPKNWQAEADYTWSRTRYTTSVAGAGLNPDARTAIRDGTTATGTPFDIFRDTNLFPVDFSQYLDAPTITRPASVRLNDTSVRFGGPLGWALPAGMPSLDLSLEHRKEVYGDYQIVGPGFSSLAYGGRSQSVDSVYVESQIPLFSAKNSVFGIHLLELQLAARRDNYKIITANSTESDPPDPAVFFERKLNSTDPTVGLRYQPVADITFRGSYGTGFLPPDMTTLVPGPMATQDFSFFELTDPRRGNEPMTVFTITTGGNLNLRPEKSESRSAGVVLTPRFAPDLRVSFDWTKIEKHDNVSGFGPEQQSIDNELLIPGLIERGPASGGFDVGPITQFNATWLNVARQTVEAYDLAADYRMETASWGVFKFSSAATRNLHNSQQVIASLPEIELVGVRAAMKWHVNSTLSWDYHDWTVSWNSNWYGSYCLRINCDEDANTIAQGSTTIPSQVYHDVSATYRYRGTSAFRPLANAEIQLGIRNVFNTSPPVITSAPFYSTLVDPRVASYWLTVRTSFGH